MIGNNFPHSSNNSFSFIGFHDYLATAECGHLNNYLQTEHFCELKVEAEQKEISSTTTNKQIYAKTETRVNLVQVLFLKVKGFS